jgi:hypothetical protein
LLRSYYFLWICFAIAFVSIRRTGRITQQEVVGVRWKSGQAIIRDLCNCGVREIAFSLEASDFKALLSRFTSSVENR